MSIAKADRKCVHWQVSGQLFGHDGDTAPSPREPRLGVSRHRHDCLALSQGASVNARRPVRKPPQPTSRRRMKDIGGCCRRTHTARAVKEKLRIREYAACRLRVVTSTVPQ